VGDVTEAMARTLEQSDSIGRAYDLCGPRVLTLRELLDYTIRLRQRRVRVIALGDRASRWQARLFERLPGQPGQPFTLDNYHSLQVDSLCKSGNGLAALGIELRDLDAEVPGYLRLATPRVHYG
jgi:NADH dehydrogenase